MSILPTTKYFSDNPILYLLSGGTQNPAAQHLNYHISASTSPASISAVENSIVWSYESSAVTTINSTSFIYLDLTSAPADDTFIIISGNSLSDFPIYQLTAKAEPKVGEFYSVTTTPSKSLYEIADSIVYALNEDVSFRKRFYAIMFNSGFGRILIESIAPGSRYNLNFYDGTSGSFNLVTKFDGFDNVRGQTLKDYNVFADVYIDCGGTFGNLSLNRRSSRRIALIEIAYNPNNEYEFDVSNILKNYVSTPLPSIGTGNIDLVHDNLLNFYLVFGEKYDEFDIGYRRRFIVGQSEVCWAFNASLDSLQYNTLTGYTVDSSFTVSGASFLTTSPNDLNTFADQKQFLSVLWSKDNSTVAYNWYVGGNYTYVDGTVVSYVGSQQTTLYSGGCITAEVSMSELDIPQSGLLSYTTGLYIREQSAATPYVLVTEEKTYVTNHECRYEYASEIHWLNTLGGWDTWLFNGELEQEVKRKSDTFTTNLNASPANTDSQLVSTDLQVDKLYTINSGLLDKSHYDWLIDLAKSSDVRLYKDNIQQAIIVTQMEPKMETTDDLYSINLTFKYAKEENILTK